MASSSNSEFKHHTYDIFLSFRGADTRKKFTDHLYKALTQAEFKTFRDDNEIERGEVIKTELEKSIKNSRMFLLVLSKNYANSKACLFELQLILEIKKESANFVLPVFYEVDPSEIKEQAMNLDFGNKGVTAEEVEGWRAALKKVASIAGMISQNQNDGYEAKFIEEIVGKLKSKLPGKRKRVDLELDENMQNLKRWLIIPPTKDFLKCTESRNREKVWDCLMNDEDRLIGICGMGGIGKTTIMKHIHNQLLEERAKFDIVYWVTVSKAFNITKIQSGIAKALNLQFLDDDDEIMRASKLYGALYQNKYVLTLDDLWEAFTLEEVGIPEPTQSNGCKIVLTTRSFDVCRKMDCRTVKVELLTEKEALTLFLSKAVRNGKALTPEVEVIAAKITKECARLPLAIVAVAGSMRGLDGIWYWRNALNELINSTKDAVDGESVVFEQLKFSYSHLENKVLQDCFLYCSLYPEDSGIPVDELIEYWIAEGLIDEMNSVEEQFDKGHAIIRTLTSCCLLEGRYNTCEVEYIRMHDLIRDMALKITRSSPRFMVKAGERLESVPCEDWVEDLERISFMESNIRELPVRPPVCSRLTTLILSRTYLQEIPDSFFTHMRCLEVLDLSGNAIKSLPESISNLENLHSLLLEVCEELEYVPSLEKLKALKVFKLTHSLIKKVPEGIQELVNLTKLDLSNNNRLRMFPSCKLRRLSKLQFLRIDKTKVKVYGKDIMCLRELKVVAVNFQNVKELNKYLISKQWQRLEKYILFVGNYFQILFGMQSGINDFGEELNGRKIAIASKSGTFGSGVNQLVLPPDIDFFLLESVHDLTSLSSISSLKNARTLNISECDGLESIFSSSSFSDDGQISLKTIETLHLMYLPRLRVLFDEIPPPNNLYINLKILLISCCNNVKNIFPIQFLQNFPNLESLSVMDCENVEDIIVEIAEMSDRGNHQDDSNSIRLPKLRWLSLTNLPSLKCIYNGVMECPSIGHVKVTGCPMVRRLPLSLPMDCQQATAPPSLKIIWGEEEWWESLEWDDPLTKTILEPFLKNEDVDDSFDDNFDELADVDDSSDDNFDELADVDDSDDNVDDADDELADVDDSDR